MAILSGGSASGTIRQRASVSWHPAACRSAARQQRRQLTVSFGGVDSGTTISKGGKEIVSSGGFASSATVNSGGTEIVSAGGTGNATSIMSGGTEIVASGGTGIDLTISSGGSGIVSAGGTVLVQSGATIAIDGSVANAGTLLAGSTGTLTLSGTVTNTHTIEALGTSATVVIASTISNSTGLILASGTTAQVELDNADILGGKLQTSSGAMLAVSGTGNVISAGTLVSGSLVEVTSGSTTTLKGGIVGSGTILETLSGGDAIVSGTVSNSGTLFASGSSSLVEIASGGVVNGGVVEVGNGVVDIVATGNESVSFLSTGSGGLEIADKAGAATAYSGKISGFGGSGHTNSGQYIDLADVTSGAGISFHYASGNAGNTSGVLTVSSGATLVATIDLRRHLLVG